MEEAPFNNTKSKKVDTDTFKCPACGGGMEFDIKTQQLLCGYCSNKVEIEKTSDEIKEYDINSVEESLSKDWGEEKRVIKCENCGAEAVLAHSSQAQFCAFCGSSHIEKLEKDAGVVPETLVPFKVTKQAAEEGFVKWLKGKFFAPNALKKSYESNRLIGVYYPCFTYDSDTYSNYTAEAGDYYYVTEYVWEEVNGQRKQVPRQVRKIRWRSVRGDYSKYYNDELINASKMFGNGKIKSIEPFHLQELTQYKPEFLSGFLAEKYTIGIKESWETAKGEISNKIRAGITDDIHADEVRALFVDTDFRKIKFKHILLPLWISAYIYKGKTFKYLINGQTGKVNGEAPLSPWKIGSLVLGICLLITLIMMFYSR